MVYSFQRYEDYKKVDDLAFDELPAGWTLKKVKHLFNIGRGRVISQEELDDNGVFPVYSSQTQNNGCLGFINTYDFDCKQITWTTDGANAGTVFLREGKHNCTNVCGTLQPINKNLNFSFYLYSLQYITQFHKRPDTNGAKIMNGEMAAISLCIPSDNEQQKIANFLDYETAKIDTLINKQEELIKLLKEKRQAVISHAVTKGLNPDAPMKDSGVEWLGDVPEHWDMKRLKYIGEAKNGLTYSPDDVVPEGEGVLVLRSSNIQDAKLSFTNNVYVNMDIPLRIRTQKDDLLICSRNGSRQLIGKNALITEEAVDMAFGAFMVVFRSKLNPYLYWVLNSPLFEYQSGSFLTSTINQLTIGNLESMEIPLPPSDEQELIRQYLIEKMDYFDQLISKSACKVDLLKERKTALISAAVTGKIDVRDWQESA